MTPWDALAGLPAPGTGTARVLLGIAAVLAAGLVKRGLAVRREGAGPGDRRRWLSVRTWALLFLVLVAMVSLGRAGVAAGMAALSVAVLRETVRLAGRPGLFRPAAAVAAAVYLWAWLEPSVVFLRAAPLAAGAWLLFEVGEGVRAGGRITDPLAVGRGFLLAVAGPSFVLAAASLPAPRGLAGAGTGATGWMLLLVVLTGVNDSAQAWWGRALGSRPMAPRISPEKTWAGLWGGVATTTAVAAALAPVLTGWGRGVPPVAAGAPVPPWAWSALPGLVVALAGTAGDLSASVLKRRAGADDSGTALPGHGGWLDRFDSLAVAAPVYVFVTLALWSFGLPG